MITFCVSSLLLVVAYFVYGAYLDRTLGIDRTRQVPAIENQDGVDYIPMPWPRVFLIQLLNIAGLGPIFGAIAGALWGPVVFLWIVFGGIFIGAVHDYIAGYISLRSNGAGLPEIIGTYLGSGPKRVMILLVMVLLVMVGAVFVMGPAKILADMNVPASVETATAPASGAQLEDPFARTASGTSATPAAQAAWLASPMFWSVLIFTYYLLATLLPIDKLIGRVYPVFGLALILMVVLIVYRMFSGAWAIPELTLENLHPAGTPIWPVMMITVACGAISGFHATQSPMMARTVTGEGFARRVFFGAMLTETFIALVWAAAAIAICHGSTVELQKMLGPAGDAVVVVRAVGNTLGHWGMVLVLLGVVALPVTTGDTAFRSARLILAELTGLNQKPFLNRIMLSLPLFLIGGWLCTIDFGVVWRYFAWLNQTLAVFTLWACTVYLRRLGRNSWITLIPAVFMSVVASAFILTNAKLGFGLGPLPGYALSIAFTLFCLALANARSRPQAA
ncbi:MAG TPA: carbon starvation CstA family protein [Candidatus Ozemobacteraceae bacterium]|nr:carbon starvation CstA family protein [Candidatus Ozemobacteraceae bacterium]HQG26977.1 carbon starvation CstA family protein [Candidatus Ozemobacteraceae bacterium]